MKAQFGSVVAVLCGLLLGLPAVQAQQTPGEPTDLYVELDTSEDGEFRAYPRNLTLTAGKNYRLELVNFSQDQLHVLMGPEFANAVSMKQIRDYPQRVARPGADLAKGIGLLPGTRVEMYFQPQKEGRYKLFCEERLHTASGLDVTIDVRR